ncbi:MAG: DUF4135 domain-containing protein [Corynebacterium sp.]|nr:DUF4135 domain-containing protein [Corynebacterium sp.]
MPAALRLESSKVIRSSLDELSYDTPVVTSFAAILHRHYREIVEQEWPTSEAIATAAAEQWERIVADIAGRWLHDRAVSSGYQVSGSSALAVRLLRAHQRVGAASCRLERDLQADSDYLGIAHPPTRVTFGLGDPHLGLQTVARLDFLDRTLIYRPHCPVSGDLISEVCSLLDMAQPPRAWDRRDHSWSEFLQEDGEVTDLQKFYSAVGQWTALGYILNGVDFHNENFIVEGNVPRLIDLETLFRPGLQSTNSENGTRWADSVLSVGTLPFKIGNGPNSIEVGLVRARPSEGGIHPFPAPVVRTLPDGTRSFEIQKAIPTDPGNTVFLEEEPQALENVKNMITAAFATTLKRAADNRHAIRDLILHAYDSIRTRVIVTPTYRYAQVQATASHPVIADDPYLFALACSQIGIWGDELLWKAEWQQLMQDDIPAFSVAMGSRDIVLLDGQKLPIPALGEVIEVTAIDNVLQKLKSLDRVEDATKEQCHWIEASFVGRYSDNRIQSGTNVPAKASVLEMLSYVVENITERVGENPDAHFGLDFLSASVGEDFDRNWQVLASNDDFYGGTAGTLYFLATYYKFSADAAVKPLLRKAALSFQRVLLRNPIQGKKLGGLATGNIGLLLSAVACAHALEWDRIDRDVYKDAAHRAMLTLIEQMTKERLVPDATLNMDAINGLASQYRAFVEIAGMLAELGEDCGRLSTLVRIFTESWLLRNDEVPDDGGFAHSSAGILDAYVASARLSRRRVSVELVEHQINAILHAALSQDQPSLGWCHGTAGLGALALNLIREESTLTQAKKLLEAIHPFLMENVDNMGMSACHGYIGVLEVLYYLGYFAKDEELQGKAGAIASELLVADLCGDGLTKEHYSTSLYCGLAGVGQLLLSLAGHRSAVVRAPWH